MKTEHYSLMTELVSQRIIDLARAIGHDKSLTDEGREAYREQIATAHACLEWLRSDQMQREVRRVA